MSMLVLREEILLASSELAKVHKDGFNKNNFLGHFSPSDFTKKKKGRHNCINARCPSNYWIFYCSINGPSTSFLWGISHGLISSHFQSQILNCWTKPANRKGLTQVVVRRALSMWHIPLGFGPDGDSQSILDRWSPYSWLGSFNHTMLGLTPASSQGHST